MKYYPKVNVPAAVLVVAIKSFIEISGINVVNPKTKCGTFGWEI